MSKVRKKGELSDLETYFFGNTQRGLGAAFRHKIEKFVQFVVRFVQPNNEKFSHCLI